MYIVDESKRLKTRFKRSKDFDKLCKLLQQEGYKVLKSDTPIYENGVNTNEWLIMVGKGLKCLVSVHYFKNENKDAEYKEIIHYITY